MEYHITKYMSLWLVVNKLDGSTNKNSTLHSSVMISSIIIQLTVVHTTSGYKHSEPNF